jgi:16S rRNA (guanine(966)-N(2))-methyltransferase RsmD
MRVISGSARGLKLKTPTNEDIRPTTDRVKESLFNIINNYIIDSNILDLFSGTGSLGIEALSRGAMKCVFVDLSKDSMSIIKDNIEKARGNDKSETMLTDYAGAISKLSLKNEKFDVIFMDPPYHKNIFIPALEKISSAKILKDDGIIIVEHDSKDTLPDNVGNLVKDRDKKYGKTTLSFYILED